MIQSDLDFKPVIENKNLVPSFTSAFTSFSAFCKGFEG